MNSVTLSGTLPNGGQTFGAHVSTDEIVVRVDDRICAAHARWMTADQAEQLGSALIAAARGSVTEDTR